MKESFDHLCLLLCNCLRSQSERQIHNPQGESTSNELKTHSDLVLTPKKKLKLNYIIYVTYKHGEIDETTR